MRLGVIARADHRGLGIQTRSVARNMQASRVLVVMVGDLTPYEETLEHDFGPGVVRPTLWQDGHLDEDAMRWLAAGSDIIYTAETTYDPDLRLIAREHDCRTVLHVNPELYVKEKCDVDQLWLPTSWLADRWPEASVVPMPAPTEEIPFNPRGRHDSLLMVHQVGHPAAYDRAGTLPTIWAAGQSRHQWLFRAQRWTKPRSRHPWIIGDVPDRADLYASGDVLVAPRRYGGLSLPLLDAAAAGMPIVALNREQDLYEGLPGWFISSGRSPLAPMPGGAVPVHQVDRRTLSRAIEAIRPDEVREKSEQARAWAEARSWDALRPLWELKLKEAACLV